MTAPATLADPLDRTRRTSLRLMGLLLVPVLLLLAVLTLLELRQRGEDAEREIERRVDERAQELASLARPAIEFVDDLRALLEAQWAAPPQAGPELAQALQPRRAAGAGRGADDGFSLDEAGATLRARQGQVWWAPPDGAAPPPQWLDRAAVFAALARVVHARTPSFESTRFLAADANAGFRYPFIAAAALAAADGQPSLRALAGARRAAADAARQRLETRPFERSRWGEPQRSATSGAAVVAHLADVFVDGAPVGEVGVDLLLDELPLRLERWQAAPARQWIVDEQGRVLAAGGPGSATASASSSDVAALPAAAAAAVRPLLADGGRLTRRLDGQLLAASRRKDSPWGYVMLVPERELLAGLLPGLWPNALIGLALVAMFVAGQWLLTRSFVTPALAILAHLRGLSIDPRHPPPERLHARWRPWLDAVTETFRTQRELQQRERQSEAFKSAIVDNALAAIVATDAAGRIVEFNPAAEAMFGCARDAVRGRPVGDVIIPARHRDAHQAGMSRLAAGGPPRALGRRMELEALRADGSEFPVEMVLWRAEVDGEANYIASLTDLSERQRAAREIERQREALRQSEKVGAMGTLLAGVAHELNNPLAIVMGRASLLEEKCGHEPALRTDARHIREAAERCGRIVRTFLNMARQKPPQRRNVQVNDLVRAAAEMLGYTLRSHGIALQLQLAAELPEVRVDGDQIGQVLLNLLVNAQQALASMPEGAREVVVTTGVEARRERREPRVWLRVVDSGPGVPAGLHAKIFEPFFTTKPEGMGTGLGLAVSRAMVREHGGDLILEAPRAGASFRISLPISGEPDGAAPTEPGRLAEAGLRRVLVVDDEAQIGELMRDMLEAEGLEVANAESGAVALELLEAARFDAIVCDLRMPDMDGAALWRQVRTRHPALARRMLFVTGDTLSPNARRFLDEARCPGLDKPFGRDDLVQAVRGLWADEGG